VKALQWKVLVDEECNLLHPFFDVVILNLCIDLRSTDVHVSSIRLMISMDKPLPSKR
jgi:hypothetical protein